MQFRSLFKNKRLPRKWCWIIGLSLTGLLAGQHAWAAQPKPTFHAYLTTTQANSNRPRTIAQEHFECSDTIYAVIEVTAPDRQQASDHLLIVNWLNPADKLEEKTRVEFKSYGKGSRACAWLRPSGSSGASIGQMFDPSFGMSEFIGKWRAEISIDKKKFKTISFDVLC